MGGVCSFLIYLSIVFKGELHTVENIELLMTSLGVLRVGGLQISFLPEGLIKMLAARDMFCVNFHHKT